MPVIGKRVQRCLCQELRIMIALQKKVVNSRRSAWGRQRRLKPRVGQEAWPGHVNVPVSRFPPALAATPRCRVSLGARTSCAAEMDAPGRGRGGCYSLRGCPWVHLATGDRKGGCDSMSHFCGVARRAAAGLAQPSSLSPAPAPQSAADAAAPVLDLQLALAMTLLSTLQQAPLPPP